uniref:Retrotransposon Orf1 n=1 Tax=Tanacetum cinerariifolium TaxID=118510 RepID=A0A699GTQ5_TANCI|nr:retrotransposon Orf1 [Tanacetum cinerariifolium]
MALPPKNKRHEWLRFDTQGYTDEEIQYFKSRLGKIYYRKVHRVQTLDFSGLAEIEDWEVTKRLSMQHKSANGEVLFTASVWRELLGIRGPLAPEKVTTTDLFFLKSMDEGMVVNVPYLLTQYLFRYAWGRKAGTHIPQPAALAIRTATQRLQRIEKDVQQMRQDHSQQHEMIERLTTKHARYSSWMVDRMTKFTNDGGMRYQRFDVSSANIHGVDILRIFIFVYVVSISMNVEGKRECVERIPSTRILSVLLEIIPDLAMRVVGTPLSSPKGTMWWLFDLTPSGRCKTDAHSMDFATIKKLAQYEDEEWNDVILEEWILDYENPDIEHVMGVMECKVGELMKNVIPLLGIRECLFRMTSNNTYQLSPEPSRQEEFEHIVMNFILDQEERVKQLEEYMKVIVGDFMQLSLKVTRRLKTNKGVGEQDEKIKKITKYPDIEVLEPLDGDKFSENPAKKHSQIPLNLSLQTHYGSDISPNVFESTQFLEDSIVDHEQRARSTRGQSSTLMKSRWKKSIGDGGFNLGNTKVASIRDPKVKLAHRCIATAILGKKESTNRVTEIDLYYLYCIYTEGVVCNIPYWLAKLLTNEMRDALSVKPIPHVFKKTSLITMRVIMELHNRVCVCPAARAVSEDDEAEEAANEGAGGSAKIYQNMSQGDWWVRHA